MLMHLPEELSFEEGAGVPEVSPHELLGRDY
jgi:hypothetical protein